MLTNNPINFLASSMPTIEIQLKKQLKQCDSREYDSLRLCGKLMLLAGMIVDDLRSQKNVSQIKEIFLIIENYIKEFGDTNKEESLEVCFFESVINPLTHDQEDIHNSFKLFVSLLGKESIRLCQQNDKFWGTKSPFLYNNEEVKK